MIIDCHYHLEERVLTVDGLLREMDRCGIHKVALMGSMIEPFREPPMFLITILQYLLENNSTRGIGKALISNFTDRGEVKILGKPYYIETDPDNEKVFAAVKNHPESFLGWVFVNPKGKKDQVAEFEKYKDSPGFIGVKAHPFWHHFQPVELAPVAERLAKTGKPLLIHAGFGEEGNFDALLAKVPDLKLILAHAGFPGYADTWKKIRGLGRMSIWTFPRQATRVTVPPARPLNTLVRTGSSSALTAPTDSTDLTTSMTTALSSAGSSVCSRIS